MKIYAYKEYDGRIRPFNLHAHTNDEGRSSSWWLEVDGDTQTLVAQDGTRSDYGDSLNWLIKEHGIEVIEVGSIVPGSGIPEDMRMDVGL
jgi:hypothetical protein